GYQIIFTPSHWRYIYGLLPINPSFNAAWLAALSVVFLGAPFPKKQAPLKWLLAVFLMAMVILGPSRQTILALAVGFGYWVIPQLNRKWLLGGLLGFLIAFSLVPTNLLSMRLRLNEGNYRSKIWTIALQAMEERPLTG